MSDGATEMMREEVKPAISLDTYFRFGSVEIFIGPLPERDDLTRAQDALRIYIQENL